MEADITGNKDIINEHDDDVIVIKKSLLITIAAALLAFLIGGTGGYFLAATTFDAGAAAAVAQIPQGGTVAQAQPQAQPTQPPARIENVNLSDSPFVGPEDAPITIVEFSDFRCGFCRRFHDETYDALMEQYEGQIRFVYRHFPVVGGQNHAEAAECAYEQDTFWEYHDALFLDPSAYTAVDSYTELAEGLGLDGERFRECYESGKYRDSVAEDIADAREYGVSGTPTFFINGVRVIGAQPLSSFTAVIDQELSQ